MSQKTTSVTTCPKCGAPNVLREEITREDILSEMDGFAAVAEYRAVRWTCPVCWHREEKQMRWTGNKWRVQAA